VKYEPVTVIAITNVRTIHLLNNRLPLDPIVVRPAVCTQKTDWRLQRARRRGQIDCLIDATWPNQSANGGDVDLA
jgi:hypothetical protein